MFNSKSIYKENPDQRLRNAETIEDFVSCFRTDMQSIRYLAHEYRLSKRKHERLWNRVFRLGICFRRMKDIAVSYKSELTLINWYQPYKDRINIRPLKYLGYFYDMHFEH